MEGGARAADERHGPERGLVRDLGEVILAQGIGWVGESESKPVQGKARHILHSLLLLSETLLPVSIQRLGEKDLGHFSPDSSHSC